jgi:hypothetical protein
MKLNNRTSTRTEPDDLTTMNGMKAVSDGAVDTDRACLDVMNR